MKKYNYQRYDYSFLRPKETWLEKYFRSSKKVASRTIGFDLVDVKPMNEPLGRLYYMDYEPIRDREGTWTMSLTSPASITSTVTAPPIPVTITTHDDLIKAYTTISNKINESSKRGTANYTVTSSNVAKMFK